MYDAIVKILKSFSDATTTANTDATAIAANKTWIFKSYKSKNA